MKGRWRRLTAAAGVCLLCISVTPRNIRAEPGTGSLSEPSLSASEEAQLNEALRQETGASGETEKTDGAAGFRIDDHPDCTVSFDSAGRRYVYTLPDGNSWSMNVPNGGFSLSPVSLIVSEGCMVLRMERNGAEYPVPDPLIFRESGDYTAELFSSGNMDLNDLQALTAAGTETVSYRASVHFGIGTSPVSSLEELAAPEKFEITSVRRDGTETESGKGKLPLTQDGNYQVLFTCTDNPQITYRLQFQTDRTVPRLTFSKDVTGKRLKPPISFEASEQDCSITVLRNGLAIAEQDHVIRDGGTYNVKIRDQAGNENSYSFVVDYPVRYLKPMWIILLAAAVFWILWVLVSTKRHTRVL